MIHGLHGAVGSGHDWDLFTDSLSTEISAINLWNLLEKKPLTLPQAGQAIARQAKQNDILIGYSMGGRLALHALLDHPQKWRAAIIVSAHPGLIEGQAERLIRDEQWATLAEQNWSQFMAEWNQQTLLAASCRGLRQASFRNQSAVAASFRHWSLGAQDNLATRLPEITCPLLWITGAGDGKFTNLAKEATALMPNSHHEIIASAGHRVPWEQPAAFSTAVRDFLAANS
ncbi:MAG: 2-succinyl-6-hydroxy-2,4-cyclohexadiene-1-carboxylate synthase [Akkermansiaceae bacterium]|jgi:2-succinyl-6-hydroxy-2,4-cyclohexadiene-1-carboxylate synthase